MASHMNRTQKSAIQARLDYAPHSLVLAAKTTYGRFANETPEDYLDGTPLEEFIWFATRGVTKDSPIEVILKGVGLERTRR